MHRTTRIYSLLSLVLLTPSLFTAGIKAQAVSVHASIDSSTMAIGQQSALHISVSGPATLTYAFPTFEGDSLVTGIEILKRNGIDTVNTENGRMELVGNYMITSFDSGLYYIPPIKILAGTDTAFSNDMGLKIITYQVDTADHKLFDIKGVESPPFVLADYAQPFILVLVFIVLLLVAWYLYRKYKKKVALDEEAAYIASLPPHMAAVLELDRLKEEKPWMAGRYKEYYSKLSDILKTYIERRFKINAPEMTTSDLLAIFYRDKEIQSVYQNLKQILQLADLVKFAKLVPVENENNLSLVNAYLFVNQTKQEEVQPPVPADTPSDEGNEDAASPAGPAESGAKPNEPNDTDYLKKYQKQ